MKYIISLVVVLLIILGPINSVAYAADSSSAAKYSGYPTFSIVSVVKNTSVTIKTNNLPPDDVFKVRMGLIGTKGVNGTIVTSFSTGKGGTQSLTFQIPAGLHGQSRIAIRIESKTGSGYYAYN